MTRTLVLLLGFVSFVVSTPAQLEELAKRAGLGSTNGLSESKVASGLKQALQVGAKKAVKITGQPNGYFGNEAIKILMPNDLRPLERGAPSDSGPRSMNSFSA